MACATSRRVLAISLAVPACSRTSIWASQPPSAASASALGSPGLASCTGSVCSHGSTGVGSAAVLADAVTPVVKTPVGPQSDPVVRPPVPPAAPAAHGAPAQGAEARFSGFADVCDASVLLVNWPPLITKVRVRSPPAAGSSSAARNVCARHPARRKTNWLDGAVAGSVKLIRRVPDEELLARERSMGSAGSRVPPGVPVAPGGGVPPAGGFPAVGEVPPGVAVPPALAVRPGVDFTPAKGISGAVGAVPAGAVPPVGGAGLAWPERVPLTNVHSGSMSTSTEIVFTEAGALRVRLVVPEAGRTTTAFTVSLLVVRRIWNGGRPGTVSVGIWPIG